MLKWFGRSPSGSNEAGKNAKEAKGDGKRHQVHLGEEESKFYFDEKLKRWRVEGEEEGEGEHDGALNSPPRMAMGAATHAWQENQPAAWQANLQEARPTTEEYGDQGTAHPTSENDVGGNYNVFQPTPTRTTAAERRSRGSIQSRYVDAFRNEGASEASSANDYSSSSHVARNADGGTHDEYSPLVPTMPKPNAANTIGQAANAVSMFVPQQAPSDANRYVSGEYATYHASDWSQERAMSMQQQHQEGEGEGETATDPSQAQAEEGEETNAQGDIGEFTQNNDFQERNQPAFQHQHQAGQDYSLRHHQALPHEPSSSFSTPHEQFEVSGDDATNSNVSSFDHGHGAPTYNANTVEDLGLQQSTLEYNNDGATVFQQEDHHTAAEVAYNYNSTSPMEEKLEEEEEFTSLPPPPPAVACVVENGTAAATCASTPHREVHRQPSLDIYLDGPSSSQQSLADRQSADTQNKLLDRVMSLEREVRSLTLRNEELSRERDKEEGEIKKNGERKRSSSSNSNNKKALVVVEEQLKEIEQVDSADSYSLTKDPFICRGVMKALVCENQILREKLKGHEEDKATMRALESDMNDLLVCLGQETAKVQALTPFAEKMGQDVESLFRASIDTKVVDPLEGTGETSTLLSQQHSHDNDSSSASSEEEISTRMATDNDDDSKTGLEEFLPEEEKVVDLDLGYVSLSQQESTGQLGLGKSGENPALINDEKKEKKKISPTYSEFGERSGSWSVGNDWNQVEGEQSDESDAEDAEEKKQKKIC